MTRVDQFESVFKRADKTPYAHEWVDVNAVLVLTDLDADALGTFSARVRAFLGNLDHKPGGEPSDTRWSTITGDRFGGVDELLALVDEEQPDLICTYRSLHSQAWRSSHTLGRYVDILAQETAVPVLLLPHPRAEIEAPESFPHGPPQYGDTGTRTVMAMTDHLTGDHHLIHWAARFTKRGGALVLTHVEDGATFERYMDVISKIPNLDTDEARETIEAQLIREPHDYIQSCAKALAEAQLGIDVEEVVTMGHRLFEYRRLIAGHDADLLVMNTKDQEQLAMHGLAYPLVVELRDVPILML
jgi:nucleotide-binding universal stress UspA family protein